MYLFGHNGRIAACITLLALCSACGNNDGEDVAVILSGTLTDSPIGGLSYRTDTLSGVTNSQGTFHYRRGESIRFMLGATQIGDIVPAAAVMTPFDLVRGAERPRATPETRPAVDVNYPSRSFAALEVPLPNMVVSDRERAFRRATNILVLLQSLDDDGDLSRIGISAATAALFENVRLSFDSDIQTFYKSKLVRHKIEEAARRGLIRNWMPRKPGQALDHFYSQLDIRQFFAAPVTVSSSLHSDFPSMQSEAYEYDAAGNLVRWTILIETDTGSRPVFVREWSYNSNGDPIVFSTDYEGDGMFDQRVSTEYDDVGRWSERRIDMNADGIVDDFESRTFDVDGTETISYDYEFDGSVDVVETTAFSDAGFETVITEYVPTGAINEITVLTYDANGNLVSSGRRYAPGIPFHRLTTRSYDVNGRLSEIRHDRNNDGTEVSVQRFERDAVGRLVGMSILGPDNTVSTMERYDYTDSGMLSSYTLYRPDSTVDSVSTWQYTDDDSLSSFATDLGGDGAAEVMHTIVFDRMENRVTVSRYDGSGVATEVQTFDYDKFGVLESVETDGVLGDVDGMADISVEVMSRPTNWVGVLDENYPRYENFVPRAVYAPTIYPGTIFAASRAPGIVQGL